jgi:hypothetical protein
MGFKGGSLLVLLFVLGGCTPMQPRGIEWGYADHCKDVRCVVQEVERWDGEEPPSVVRMPLMEGYRDSPLTWMYDNGYLTIETMPLYVHAFSLATGSVILGLAEITPGLFGEIYKCHILYTPVPSWRILIHELSHCQGYLDRWDMTSHYGYTEEQRRIMAEEGVSKWADTEFFKKGLHMGEGYIHRIWGK